MDQVGPEVRLQVGLAVVQPDQRLAEVDRRQRAQRPRTPTATPKRSGLIVQSTPENDRTASSPLRNISVNDSVVVVNVADVVGDPLIGVVDARPAP